MGGKVKSYRLNIPVKNAARESSHDNEDTIAPCRTFFMAEMNILEAVRENISIDIIKSFIDKMPKLPKTAFTREAVITLYNYGLNQITILAAFGIKSGGSGAFWLKKVGIKAWPPPHETYDINDVIASMKSEPDPYEKWDEKTNEGTDTNGLVTADPADRDTSAEPDWAFSMGDYSSDKHPYIRIRHDGYVYISGLAVDGQSVDVAFTSDMKRCKLNTGRFRLHKRSGIGYEFACPKEILTRIQAQLQLPIVYRMNADTMVGELVR